MGDKFPLAPSDFYMLAGPPMAFIQPIQKGLAQKFEPSMASLNFKG